MVDREEKYIGTISGKLMAYILLALGGVISLMPLYWLVLTSLRPAGAEFTYPPEWNPPPSFHPENYGVAWNRAPFWLFTFNSILVTFLGHAGHAPHRVDGGLRLCPHPLLWPQRLVRAYALDDDATVGSHADPALPALQISEPARFAVAALSAVLVRRRGFLYLSCAPVHYDATGRDGGGGRRRRRIAAAHLSDDYDAADQTGDRGGGRLLFHSTLERFHGGR